jgi:hypothetical protein
MSMEYILRIMKPMLEGAQMTVILAKAAYLL